jgi:hypothetical protein
MEIKNIITQELFDSLNIIKGDLNLSYVLREKIKIKELNSIVNECRKLYRKLIDNYLDIDIYDYESMIYYSPQYKVYQETNTTNIFVFVVTPVGKCGLIQITNKSNQNTKSFKNKCLI